MMKSSHRRKMEPYLLQPYNAGGAEDGGTTTMAPHPMSDARLAEGLVMDTGDAGPPTGERGATGLKKLFQLRKITTFPSTHSVSNVVQIDPNRSYKSFETMHIDRREHFRPQFGPRDRFDRARP